MTSKSKIEEMAEAIEKQIDYQADDEEYCVTSAKLMAAALLKEAKKLAFKPLDFTGSDVKMLKISDLEKLFTPPPGEK